MEGDGHSVLDIFIYFLFYAFLALVLYLWIIFLVCSCLRASRRVNAAVAPPAVHLPLSSEGLEPSVIEKLPTLRFAAGAEESSEGKRRSECVVCLAVFEENEMLRLMPNCGHVFHSRCVDIWLSSHATCPYCRAAVAPPPAGDSSEVRIAVVPLPPPSASL